MTVLFALIACAPSEFFSSSDVSDAGDVPALSPADSEALASESLGGEREAASYTGAARLEVQLPAGTSEGFVELRAFRADGAEIDWVGRPLVLREVEGTRETVALPVEAPRGDRLSADEPVVYALSLRAMDASGRPGVYLGVSTTRLVHVRADGPDGAIAGWNVVDGHGTEGEMWRGLDEVVHVDRNAFASRTAELAGTSALDVTDETRLVVAVSAAPDAEVVVDRPAAEDWSLTLGASPSVTVFGTAAAEEGAPLGSEFELFTYKDIDGDGFRADAPVDGRVCAGSDPAVLSWYEPATTLTEAFSLIELGARGGWEIFRDAEDGLRRLTVEEREALVVDRC
jgi:hypothetical protein